MNFAPYYGLDYVAAATAIFGMYFVGNRNRIGLALYAVSSLAMIVFALLATSLPILIANAIALVMAIRAFLRWSAKATARLSVSAACYYRPSGVRTPTQASRIWW